MSRLRTSVSLRRVDGTPCTMTSKTAWSSNTLPTWMPCSSVASARRTEPGVTPKACAFARSTSISIVGCICVVATRGSTTPSMPAISFWTTRGLLVQHDRILAVEPDRQRLVQAGEHVQPAALDGVLAGHQGADVAHLLGRVGHDLGAQLRRPAGGLL